MLAKVVGQGQTVMLDLHTEVSWGSAPAREYGNLTFTVQRGSAAWSHDVLSEAGGFLVEIATNVGRLRTIADKPTYTPAGMTFKGLPLEHWLSERVVGPNQTFRSALAGHVFQAGFRDAIAGRVQLKLGSVMMAPPLISEITFQGQSFMEVIHALMNETGHEWWIDDDLRLHWGAYQGRFHERWIVDDGAIFKRLQLGSLLEIDSEVIEIEPDGATFVAHGGTAPLLWPSQRVVKL